MTLLDKSIYGLFGGAILVGIVMLARIVLPKFRQLALIDTSIIPEEREAKKKREIMHGRTHRILSDAVRTTNTAIAPRWEQVRDAFRSKYRKLLDANRAFKREKPLTPPETRERIVTAVTQAKAFAEADKTVEAEKKFLEALGYDPRHVEAYRGLADLYMDAKRYERAKETLQFLIKSLIRDNRCIHGAGRRSFAQTAEANPNACPASHAAHADIAERCIALAAALSELKDEEGSRASFELAVNMEPTNPRHLDLLIEACILGGDKRRAEEVFEALKDANPENMKLEEFRERIIALVEPAEAKRRRKR